MLETLAVIKCCFAQTFQVVGAMGVAPIRYGTERVKHKGKVHLEQAMKAKRWS